MITSTAQVIQPLFRKSTFNKRKPAPDMQTGSPVEILRLHLPGLAMCSLSLGRLRKLATSRTEH